MRILVVLAALATLAVAATAAAAPGAKDATVSVHASRFGKILFDDRGFVLYAFTRDARGRSSCRQAALTGARDARTSLRLSLRWAQRGTLGGAETASIAFSAPTTQARRTAERFEAPRFVFEACAPL